MDTGPLLLQTSGQDDLALVHLLQLGEGPDRVVETVDSIDPRFSRQDKTVIIISTQFGCPVRCVMCDAGTSFSGNLTAEQMLDQVRFVLGRRPEIMVSRKLKVHFARMGEPALNPAVIEALCRLPDLLPAPGLMACVASVAPAGCAPFFDRLRAVKEQRYGRGCFQLQLSVNSTDPATRRRLIPHPHLDLEELAELGGPFCQDGDRKVALNFALARGVEVDPRRLRELFDPACFMVKLTPVNPTRRAEQSGLHTLLSACETDAGQDLVEALGAAGFDVVVSIGEPEEIRIGSNCGQLVLARRTT